MSILSCSNPVNQIPNLILCPVPAAPSSAGTARVGAAMAEAAAAAAATATTLPLPTTASTATRAPDPVPTHPVSTGTTDVLQGILVPRDCT